MAIQFGTVDGLVNISETTIRCFTQAIYEFCSMGGPSYSKERNIAYGSAFQRFVEPVYSGGKNQFEIESINNPVFSQSGNEQSPARATFCKKMGLLEINEPEGVFQLTPIGYAILNNDITIQEYAFILLSKLGVFKDGNYVDNVFNVFATYYQTNTVLSSASLLDYLKAKYNDNSFEKTRDDIIINAFTFTRLITKIDKDTYTLTNTGYALIFSDFCKHKSSLTPAAYDGDSNYSKYIGALDYGIFNILTKDNASIYTQYFPNLKKYIKDFGEKYTNIIPSGYKGKIIPTIYYGAPGTGKTRFVQEELFKKYDNANRVFTTFHQSYSYEDFVEGLKPILDDNSENVKYHIEQGVFYKACERAAILAGYNSLKDCIADSAENRIVKFKAAKDNNMTMLLCIDEINRGNVASIFGDLISLIEPSKRLGAEYEMSVTLPYSKKAFGVPANLFIVGTMNTADRSIQLLDSALRRRFRFEEMLPNYDVITNETAKTILKKINARIRSVLNKDNQIGHSYFIGVNSDKDIVKALVNKIIPLLEEYFYNDINKVRFILNEDDKTATAFYIKDVEAEKAYQALSLDETEEDKSFYKLDESIANLSDADCGKYLEHLK